MAVWDRVVHGGSIVLVQSQDPKTALATDGL